MLQHSFSRFIMPFFHNCCDSERNVATLFFVFFIELCRDILWKCLDITSLPCTAGLRRICRNIVGPCRDIVAPSDVFILYCIFVATFVHGILLELCHDIVGLCRDIVVSFLVFGFVVDLSQHFGLTFFLIFYCNINF